MVKNLEDMQTFGKDSVDATLTSFEVLSKGVQAIAVEVANYAKKAFEEGATATEKLIAAKSLDKAMEVQANYLKSAYEAFAAQSTKLGGLYAGLAREVGKPFERCAKTAAAK
jgi:hypothetical protein